LERINSDKTVKEYSMAQRYRSRKATNKFQTTGQVNRVANRLGNFLLATRRQKMDTAREHHEQLLYELARQTGTEEAKSAVHLRIQGIRDQKLRGFSTEQIKAMAKKSRQKRQSGRAFDKLLAKGNLKSAKEWILEQEKKAKKAADLAIVSFAWIELAQETEKQMEGPGKKQELEYCWKKALETAKKTNDPKLEQTVRVGARLRGIKIE